MQDFRMPPGSSSTPQVRTQTGFFQQVYLWMAAGLALTGVMAWVTIHNQAILSLVANWYWPLAILEIGMVLFLSVRIHKMTGATATATFLLYSLLNGLTLSLLFLVFTQQSIVSTFFISAGMFAAAGAFGYVTKRDLNGFGQFLFMGLIGIIIASIVNFFLKSPAVTWAVSVLGVLIFTGLTAYDHQKLREMSLELDSNPQDGNAVRRLVVMGALTLYLDFINLFVMLLRLFGDRR